MGCVAAIGLLMAYRRHTTEWLPTKVIYSFQEAAQELAQADASTLVLFDIDETVITAPDVLSRDFKFPWWFPLRVFWEHPHLMLPHNFDQIISLIMKHSSNILIEDEIVHLINKLHEQGATVLALTYLRTGTCGEIEDVPAWRYKRLEDLGIMFTQTHGDTTFKHLPQKYANYPVIHKGLICTNRQDKGEVLSAFLEHINFTPSKIIFFDDNPSRLQEVGVACSALDIPCTLFHYRGAENLPGEWDTEIALAQIKTVLHEQRWLSDAEARTLVAAS